MPREPIEVGPELTVLLRRLSLTYCWDMKPEDALLQPLRVLRRSIDFAVWDDVLALEAIVGRPLLTKALKTSPMGAMRPKSWSFWHVRLGLRGPDGEIPPEPSDRFAEPEE